MTTLEELRDVPMCCGTPLRDDKCIVCGDDYRNSPQHTLVGALNFLNGLNQEIYFFVQKVSLDGFLRAACISHLNLMGVSESFLNGWIQTHSIK